MNGFYSLKTTEYIVGKNISETSVDFDLDRPLTDEEKKLTDIKMIFYKLIILYFDVLFCSNI